MTKEARKFLGEISDALISEDSAAIEKLTASWLPSNPDDCILKAVKTVETATRRMMHDETLGPASGYELEDSFCTFPDLQEDGVKVPERFEEKNFHSWWCICMQADKGEWSLYDIWIAIAREKDDLVIGYFEVMSPD